MRSVRWTRDPAPIRYTVTAHVFLQLKIGRFEKLFSRFGYAYPCGSYIFEYGETMCGNERIYLLLKQLNKSGEVFIGAGEGFL